MVKNALVILLLLTASALATDSLRVTCSADGFILKDSSFSTVKSFSIGSTTAAKGGLLQLISATGINDNAPGVNNGAGTTARIGKNASAIYKWLIRWDSMDDSMRTIFAANQGHVVWDSARVSINVNTAPTSGDSVTIGVFELNSGRRFVEGTSNAAEGLGASWWNYDSTAGTAYPWSTAGAGSTTNDYVNTSLSSFIATNGNSTADTWHHFPITAANTVSDTFNNVGLLMYATAFGGDDGTSSTVLYKMDDFATDSTDRPVLNVFYRTYEYNNYGGADSIRFSSAAKPIWTFDISSLPSNIALESCSLWAYVQTATLTANTGVGMMVKPSNIGDNAGTAADAGEMHYRAWYNSATDDSGWGTAGATNQGSTCNRSDSSGHDYRNNSDALTAIKFDNTGWKNQEFDTSFVNAHRYTSGCNMGLLALTLLDRDGEQDPVLVFEAKEKAASANDAFIVIYYHQNATTRGTGRFGKSTTGVYLNVR